MFIKDCWALSIAWLLNLSLFDKMLTRIPTGKWWPWSLGDSYECSYGSNNKTDEVTLLGTNNISHPKGSFEDDFPLLKVGYLSSLERNIFLRGLHTILILDIKVCSEQVLQRDVRPFVANLNVFRSDEGSHMKDDVIMWYQLPTEW